MLQSFNRLEHQGLLLAALILQIKTDYFIEHRVYVAIIRVTCCVCEEKKTNLLI